MLSPVQAPLLQSATPVPQSSRQQQQCEDNNRNQLTFNSILEQCHGLHVAVFQQDVKQVESLLASGSDPNCLTSNQKYTPVYLTLLTGCNEILQLLLENRANPNKPCYRRGGVNFTPILEAINRKNVKAVELLIKTGGNVNYSHKSLRFSPLGFAVVSQCVPIVEMLLKAGADPNFKNRSTCNQHPLVLAFSNGNKAIYDLLLQYGADKDHSFVSPNGFSFLYMLITLEWSEMLDSLLTYSSDKTTLLTTSCGQIHELCISTPMHIAVIKNSPRILNVLVSHGAPVNSKQQGYFGPLHVAAVSNKLEAAAFLIEKGATINDCVAYPFKSPRIPHLIGPQTPLSIACSLGHIGMAEMLLHRGASVVHPDHNLCVKNDHFFLAKNLQESRAKLVNLLLLKGLPLSGRCMCHGTLNMLELCIIREIYEVAAVLVSHGADVNLEICKTGLNSVLEHDKKVPDSLERLSVKAITKKCLLRKPDNFSTSIWPSIDCLQVPTIMKDILKMKPLQCKWLQNMLEQQQQQQQQQQQ